MCASPIIVLSCATSTCARRPRHRSPPPPSRETAMTNTNGTSWTTATDADGIVWLTLDKPGTSANVLSSTVLIELDALLRPLQQSAPRGVVVSSAKKSGFVAGADIKEFTGLT